MNIRKILVLSIAIFFSALTTVFAARVPTDSEAMTCTAAFQIIKAASKDPVAIEQANDAANLFSAYLIKKGMKEADFISLYDAKMKSVEDLLAKRNETAWEKILSDCTEFSEDLL